MNFIRNNFIIISLFLLVLLDQTFKIWVKMTMKLGDEIVIFDWFKIFFIENNGMAFGIELGGDLGKLALTSFRIIAVILIFIWLKKIIREGQSKILIASLVLILAGAIGNILDSMFYGVLFSESTFQEVAVLLPEGGGYESMLFGKVVDMLYFPLFEVFLPDWIPFFGGKYFKFFEPVFNLADTFVSIGIGLMIIFQLFCKQVKKI